MPIRTSGRHFTACGESLQPPSVTKGKQIDTPPPPSTLQHAQPLSRLTHRKLGSQCIAGPCTARPGAIGPVSYPQRSPTSDPVLASVDRAASLPSDAAGPPASSMQSKLCRHNWLKPEASRTPLPLSLPASLPPSSTPTTEPPHATCSTLRMRTHEWSAHRDRVRRPTVQPALIKARPYRWQPAQNKSSGRLARLAFDNRPTRR